MEFLTEALNIFLHVDQHLGVFIRDHGFWVYGLLFLVIFCETGLVVTPFLPGDSLLFACGALAASVDGGLSMAILIPLLIVAAVLGDAVNYSIGYKIGPGYLAKGKLRFIKTEHLQKTQRFYEKYGGKTIILARFVPIVRTFAPFVAGIGRMDYKRFGLFNITGGIAWVLICSFAGFFFGNIPIVKKNFEIVILGIIFVSVLPIAIEMGKGWMEKRRGVAA